MAAVANMRREFEFPPDIDEIIDVDPRSMM